MRGILRTKSYWKLRSSKILLSLYLLSFVSYQLIAQQASSDGKYYFPVRPNDKNYLSGTMGEVRGSHFHAGMDIKTSGISGLPVYATQSGHVSRIKVSSGGYGHALYIQHSNGETSVYAHLLKFKTKIADYVRHQQYDKQSFNLDLFPDESMFPVQRGDLIALSGNTGSSQGPHLHFELRDPNQKPINPLNKGFNEIVDDIPPFVQGIALKTMSINARITNQFGRFEYKANKRDSIFYIDDPIRVNGEIGVQIKAYDKLNGASNRNGIPYISVFFDDKKILEVQIDSFSFSESRHVANYYDYQARKERRGTYLKLYIDDGNYLPFYRFNFNSGLLNIDDNNLHEVKIILKDAYGNSSTLLIPLQGAIPETRIAKIETYSPNEIETSLIENLLAIKGPCISSTPNHAFLYGNRMVYELMPSYYSTEAAVYLWDMKLGLPDSISICDVSKKFQYEVMLPSGLEFNFYNKVFDIKLYRRSLYDTLYLEMEHTILPDREIETYKIGNNKTPLANPILITFKPQLDYSSSEKYAVFSTEDFNNFGFVGNNWENDEIKIRTKSLGYFVILADTLAPTIKPKQVNHKKISFRIKDDLSGIKKYNAYLNKEWLLMHYDPKQNYIWSETIEPNIPLKGEFKLVVEDNVGNISNYETEIK